VTDVLPLDGGDGRELLLLAAEAEKKSEHPLGQAVVAAAAGGSGGAGPPDPQASRPCPAAGCAPRGTGGRPGWAPGR
jgi:cation transport ATPase